MMAGFPGEHKEYGFGVGEGQTPSAQNPEPNHAKIAPRVDLGYDIKGVRLNEKRREAARARRNGSLTDSKGNFVRFFAHDIEMDLALAGSTAQSLYNWDFYAHNMVLPSMTVLGQCLDQEEYGTIVEFVHEMQQRAVNKNDLLWLRIGGGLKVKQKTIHMRGDHKETLIQGFISDMPRQYKKFVYAPVFSFPFTIASMVKGIYKETSEEGQEQEGWIKLLKDKSTFVVPQKPESEFGPPLTKKGRAELEVSEVNSIAEKIINEIKF